MAGPFLVGFASSVGGVLFSVCFPFAAIFVFMLVSSLVFESISFRGFFGGVQCLALIRVRYLFTFVGVLLLARVDA